MSTTSSATVQTFLKLGCFEYNDGVVMEPIAIGMHANGTHIMANRFVMNGSTIVMYKTNGAPVWDACTSKWLSGEKPEWVGVNAFVGDFFTGVRDTLIIKTKPIAVVPVVDDDELVVNETTLRLPELEAPIHLQFKVEIDAPPRFKVAVRMSPLFPRKWDKSRLMGFGP